jgi:hypothetical protein
VSKYFILTELLDVFDQRASFDWRPVLQRDEIQGVYDIVGVELSAVMNQTPLRRSTRASCHRPISIVLRDCRCTRRSLDRGGSEYQITVAMIVPMVDCGRDRHRPFDRAKRTGYPAGRDAGVAIARGQQHGVNPHKRPIFVRARLISGHLVGRYLIGVA